MASTYYTYYILLPTDNHTAILVTEYSNGRKTFFPWYGGLEDCDSPLIDSMESAEVNWAKEADGIREACKSLDDHKPIVLNTHKTILARSLRHLEIEIQIVTNGLEEITEANNIQFWRLIPNSFTMWAMYTKLAKLSASVHFLQSKLATASGKDYEEELAKMYTPWPITHTPLGYWDALKFDAAAATTKMAELLGSITDKLDVLREDVLRECAPALLLPPPGGAR